MRRRSSASPAARRVLLVVLALGGALYTAWDLEPSLTFRPVDAVVESAGIRRIRNTGARRYGKPRNRVPAVVYRYVVEGRTWTSRRWQRTPAGMPEADAIEKASRYVPGARVQAWYNPRNPGDAVLNRSPNFFVIAAIWVVALLVWLAGRWQRRTGPPPPSAPKKVDNKVEKIEPISGMPPPIE